MPDLDEIYRELEKLKKVIWAIALKQGLKADENGDVAPSPCIVSAHAGGRGQFWCETHGYDCPNMAHRTSAQVA